MSKSKVRGKLSAALDDTKSPRPNPMPKANRSIRLDQVNLTYPFILCTAGLMSFRNPPRASKICHNVTLLHPNAEKEISAPAPQEE